MRHIFILASLVGALFLTSCANTAHTGIIESEKSAVNLRSMQTRAFDTTDKEKIMESAIATLQDLNFVVDNADYDIGTIKATQLDGHNLTMSVVVRPKGTTQMLVRANARYNTSAIEDPKMYQDFFTSLSKGVFLDAHLVE